MAYTKLFNSIITSSIWGESDTTRIVWITLLALADKNGEVQASIPGLARIACVSLADCETAVTAFLSPDPYSRTADDEGRRIEKIDGGWCLLNHNKYRQMASKEDAVTQNAERQARFKAKQQRNEKVTVGNGQVTESRYIAEAYTDTDTKPDTEVKNTSANADDISPEKSLTVKKTKRTKRSTTLPNDFTVTDSMASWFSINCPRLDIDSETAQFKERCIAKGTEYVDWSAGWRTQMLNAEKWFKETNYGKRTNAEIANEYRAYGQAQQVARSHQQNQIDSGLEYDPSGGWETNG